MPAPRAFRPGLLGDDPSLDRGLERRWLAVLRAFPGEALGGWLATCRALRHGVAGRMAALGYIGSAVDCAETVGAPAAIALGEAAATVAGLTGERGVQGLLAAAPGVARRLRRAASFRAWLEVIERLAALAPESLPALLDRSEGLLAELDPRGLEAWALSGIRAAGGDPRRRLDFFTFTDRQARRWLEREAGDVLFSDVETRLKAYLTALWRLRAPIRAVAAGEGAARRASFGDGLIRVPDSFRGVAGQQATELFRASLAHAGAHLRYTPERFPVGTLKPMQIALVSLIEDARVEQQAMADMPGLRRLWLPFHVAEPGGAQTAPVLMARLARAIIDPGYRDDDAWVRKGRSAFLDHRDRWHDPAISRSIGGLLGNDLGQMRVQFNPRTYVVEPAYRDDNLGLWDFGADPPPPDAVADLLYESVRLDRQEQESGERERQDTPPKEEADEAPANRARPAAALPDDAGIPVARYAEWDYQLGRDRPGWTTILDVPAVPGRGDLVERILESHDDQLRRLSSLIRAAKVSRPVRIRRQPEGDRLDLDACIEAAVTHRIGATPDPRVYADVTRRHRDLSVLVLLDISESTNDIVRGDIGSVLALERAATALLAHAMAGLGDPFAIHAFCSNGRDEVRYVRVKDFPEPYDGAARARLAGLKGSLSTRIGAAIRHAGRLLERRLTHRRLLLIVTDGEPSDVDVIDRNYLVQDARKAVASLSHAGIDVFCVGLDAGGDSYLTQIFGRRNVVQIDRLERLPEKLPMLYLRLTG